MSKVAIFASGKGSNAKRIIEHFESIDSSVIIDCIISNKENEGIYFVAEDANISFFYFNNESFVNSKEVIDLLLKRGVEWIVLAGFLRKMNTSLIEIFENRIINLHPSLLPKYGGKGMYGKYVHQAVLNNREDKSGITIHFVNEKFDDGKIIFQKECLLDKNESEEGLAKKIQVLEHTYFPKVIEQEIQKKN